MFYPSALRSRLTLQYSVESSVNHILSESDDNARIRRYERLNRGDVITLNQKLVGSYYHWLFISFIATVRGSTFTLVLPMESGTSNPQVTVRLESQDINIMQNSKLRTNEAISDVSLVVRVV